MLIRMHLFAEGNGNGDVQFWATDPNATDVVGRFDGTTRVAEVREILLHDLFHHTALRLPYDARGEYLSANLDGLYRWYPGDHRTEVVNTRRTLIDLGEPVPTRQEVQRLRSRARRRLGRVRPLEWIGTLQQALGTYFRGRKPHEGDVRLVLSVDKKKKRARVRRVARLTVASGEQP